MNDADVGKIIDRVLGQIKDFRNEVFREIDVVSKKIDNIEQKIREDTKELFQKINKNDTETALIYQRIKTHEQGHDDKLNEAKRGLDVKIDIFKVEHEKMHDREFKNMIFQFKKVGFVISIFMGLLYFLISYFTR